MYREEVDTDGDLGELELPEYPQTVEDVVANLPAMGEWANDYSQEQFEIIGDSLLKDFGLGFEDMKDVLETVYEAAKKEFSE